MKTTGVSPLALARSTCSSVVGNVSAADIGLLLSESVGLLSRRYVREPPPTGPAAGSTLLMNV
jgi:hypothetical protein